MSRFVFGLLILLACASGCLAHGSIAFGYAGNAIRFTTSQNESSEINARIAALQRCRAEGLQFCDTLTNVQNNCAAVAITPAGAYNSHDGDDAEQARSFATAVCTGAHQIACNVAVTVCDSTPTYAPAQQATSPEPSEDADSPSLILTFPEYFASRELPTA
jgi:hypothetical protein